MRIIFAGTPDVAVPSLHTLVGSPHEVVAVITRPDAHQGRRRALTPSPVSLAAEETGIEVLKPETPRDPQFQARLAEIAPDVVATVAYGLLIPTEALAIPRLGWINLHFSLLPTWRGAAPVQHAILAGDEVTGATVFQIVEELDAGPIFGQMTYTIPKRANAGQVLHDLATSADSLLLATLNAMEDGSAQPVAQDHRLATRAPKMTDDDGRILFDAPHLAIDRRIRATSPAPGAWTTWRGERIALATPGTQPGAGHKLAPGEILATKKSVWVGTLTDPLNLGDVRPAGRSGWMDAAAWARGARIEDGERFGDHSDG